MCVAEMEEELAEHAKDSEAKSKATSLLPNVNHICLLHLTAA